MIAALILANATTQQGFFDGGSLFNRWNFYITVVGTVLGLAGIAFTIWTVFQAVSAAKAAETASKRTSDRIYSLEILFDLAMLTRWCSEVNISIQTADYSLALARTTDLQAALSQLAATDAGQGLQSGRKWTELRNSLRSVETALADARRATDGAVNTDALVNAEGSMREIYYSIMTLTEKARNITGTS